MQIDRRGERADEGGLAETGRALEEDVAIGKERGEHAFNDFVLADDDALQLRFQPVKVVTEFGGALGHRGRFGHGAETYRRDRSNEQVFFVWDTEVDFNKIPKLAKFTK